LPCLYDSVGQDVTSTVSRRERAGANFPFESQRVCAASDVVEERAIRADKV